MGAVTTAPEAWFGWSPAAERNREPVGARLLPLIEGARTVLEVGAGSGQHAVAFSGALRDGAWLATETPAALEGLRRNLARHGPHMPEPRALDVQDAPWDVPCPDPGFDAVYTANTLHIMGWPEVRAFVQGAAGVLGPGGLLVVYGPMRYGGAFTAESNAAFDAWLRERDPASGIRDFEAVHEQARAQGLRLCHDFAMPANNQLLVWQRRA